MTEIMPVPRNLNFTVLPAGSFRSGFLGTLDLTGKIAAVQVIDQCPEGCVETVNILRIDAVKAVVDGDKAHSEERKDAGDIVTDRDVITPETRQVFDHNTVDLAVLDLFQKLLHRGTLEVRAAPAVVTKFQNFRTG